MKKEKNNFARAVDWLIENKKVKEQKEIAERMDTTEATISRIKKGRVKHPGPETIRRFGEQFGEFINIAYIRGESDVMLVEDLPAAASGGAPSGQSTTPSAVDALTAALLAEKDARIADMKRELGGKDKTILAKDETIASQRRELETKEALIKNLQQTVADLRAKQAMEKGLSTGRSHSDSAEPQAAV